MVGDSSVNGIIQARMGSTRLPGKVMKKIFGKPILRHIVDRVRHSHKLDQIVIATTTLSEDDIIEKFCLENKINIFRGSLENVLSRYYFASLKFPSEIIVRLTGDNPLVDPIVIDRAIIEFHNLNKDKVKIDYLSTSLYPRGLNVEVFTFLSLEKAYKEDTNSYEREHVTPFIYQHPKIFNLSNYKNENDYSNYRLTLDTDKDFKDIKEIYKALYKNNSLFLLNDVILLLERSEIGKNQFRSKTNGNKHLRN